MTLRDVVLRNALSKFDVEVTVQPTFKTGATHMLEKLENLIEEADHVIALVGRQSGLVVGNMDLQPVKYGELLAKYPFDKLSLTQWEQLFAHRAGKLRFLCVAEDQFFSVAAPEDDLQRRWKEFLLDEGLILDRLYFSSEDNLISELRGIDKYQSMVRGELQTEQCTPASMLEPSQQAVCNALSAGNEPQTADILNSRNPKQPIDSIQKYLLQRWASGAAPQAVSSTGRLHYQFVPLHITLDLQRLGIQKEAGQQAEVHEYLQQVLDKHDNLHQGWLLAGGPGSGKTTVLQHFEMTCARATLLQSDTQLQANTELPQLCIWMHLGDYRVGENQQLPDPNDWLAAKWKDRCPELSDLPTLGKRYRLRFLLDGINEMQPGAGISRRQAEQRWATWAADIAAHHLPPVFSVRPLEYHDGLKSGSFCVTEIRLMHWQREQIRSFIDKRQSDGVGEGGGSLQGLWEAIDAQIQEDPSLEQFHGLPMNLNHQCELYETLGRLVTRRAELYGGILCLRLHKEQQTLEKNNLLGSVYSVRSLNDGSWQQNLTAIPSVALLPHLEQLALAMGTSIVVDPVMVETCLGENFDAVMQCIELLHLGSIQGTDQGTKFKFVHQSWREYFAARALINLQPAQWPECHPTQWKQELDTELAGLTALQRLSEVDYSPWAETYKLMLQLQQPAKREALLDYLIQQHPALAARAAAPIKEVLPAQYIEGLQLQLLAQSRDSMVDLRLRIDDGHALGELGDPRYQWHRSDEDADYLLPRDEYCISIPAGEYPVGSSDSDAHENERMSDNRSVARLAIEEFHLAFAPVTNAEYGCFIRDDGYNDERWWTGAAQAWWRGDNEQTQSIEIYTSIRDGMQQAGSPDAARQYLKDNYPIISSGQIEGLLPLLEISQDDFEQCLQDNFSATQYRLPQNWNGSHVSYPNKPVTGVSWYEARAYCLWLAFVSNKPIRLPTEAEWQAAAAGSSNRRWPWGGQPPAPKMPEYWQCNMESTHVRGTTPVGVFPQSDTPGERVLVDMAGNVQEWCSSAWCDHVDIEVVNTVEAVSDADRVIRGGSWNDRATNCRAAYRYGNHPDGRIGTRGFRVGLFPVHSCQPDNQPKQ